MRIDLIQIEFAWMVDRFTHRISRDRVEADAPEAVAVVRSVAQRAGDMVADRLALPVRIGSDQDVLGALRLLLQVCE